MPRKPTETPRRTPSPRKPATRRPAAKAASSLRAVTPADAEAAAAAAKAAEKPKTVSQAAEVGTHRELLVAMRSRIARAVESDHTSPRDLAALTRRLTEIAREIEAIDAAAKQEADESVVPEDEAFDPEAL